MKKQSDNCSQERHHGGESDFFRRGDYIPGIWVDGMLGLMLLIEGFPRPGILINQLDSYMYRVINHFVKAYMGYLKLSNRGRGSPKCQKLSAKGREALQNSWRLHTRGEGQ